MGRFLGILTAGLVGVLIVGAIAIYGLDSIRTIEAGLQRAADRTLEETGPPWASVEVRGRDAILKGEALLPAERRQAAERAALAIDAIPGIREVRDNTTARFRSLAEIEVRLADICKRAASDLPAGWLKCAVKAQTVTLSGTALTHTARREAVERVFTAVEALNARETFRDTTLAHYQTSGEMRAVFGASCKAAIAGFHAQLAEMHAPRTQLHPFRRCAGRNGARGAGRRGKGGARSRQGCRKHRRRNDRFAGPVVRRGLPQGLRRAETGRADPICPRRGDGRA